MPEEKIGLNAHNFLKACYLNKDLPVPTRMKAAQICIGYEMPRLAATAIVSMDMGEAMSRARKRLMEFNAKRAKGEVMAARNGEVYALPALIEEQAGPPDESQPVTPVKRRRF